MGTESPSWVAWTFHQRRIYYPETYKTYYTVFEVLDILVSFRSMLLIYEKVAETTRINKYTKYFLEIHTLLISYDTIKFELFWTSFFRKKKKNKNKRKRKKK